MAKNSQNRILRSEPLKPDYIVEYPKGVDENNPDISSKNLPLKLPMILRDLDSLLENSNKTGCHLVLSSFVWLPYEGMLLDPVRHESISQNINEKHWPLKYADFKRLSDFQNKVFALYAKAHHLDFIDVSYFFPRNPDLFIDAIHFTDEGIRLQAWIVFQELIPIIRQKIESGKLPRPDQEYINEHPCIRPGIRNGFASC